MGRRLTDEERSQRKKERTARLFASYRTHDGAARGNPDAWKRAATAAICPDTRTDDLAALGLEAMPDSLDALRAAYYAAIRACHPDRGGDTEKAALVNAAYERLKRGKPL